MELTTKIKLPKSKSINYNSKILILGSCFAENIGAKLAKNYFDVVINPMGIIYNPLSMAAIINRLIDGNNFTEEELFENNSVWASFMHHSRFSSSDKVAVLESINREFELGREQLRNATELIITLGSSYVYELCNAENKDENKIVNNCHKLPANMFVERQTSVEEITTALGNCLQRVEEFNKSIKTTITISPVRYLGRGANSGQINKATLILATYTLCNLNAHQRRYFPAYEIMMDELRDYRFYAKDMIHPSEIAIEYIWERFIESSATDETRKLIERIEKINLSLSHRPLHPDSESYKLFQAKLQEQIALIREEYPQIKIGE